MTLALGALWLLALTLAWPVPLVLSRASWPDRSPGLALLLWQGVALGGALSMFGALLGLAFVPPGLPAPQALTELWKGLGTAALPAGWGAINVASLTAALLLGLLLVANVVHAVWVTERRRRRHRLRVDLLSSRLAGRDDIHLLDHPAPLAFCLPGLRNMTVLSSGLVELFSPEELDAVLAHERAHLRQYHHLVLLSFRAWNDALPWFPIASQATKAVAALVEFRADDDAITSTSAPVLAGAIRHVGGSWDSLDDDHGLSADTALAARRIERLENPKPALNTFAKAVIVSSAIALVGAPLVFLSALVWGV